MLIAIAANNELGAQALLYYLIPYSAMSLGAFAVVAARERELGAAGDARRTSPAWAGSGRCSASRCGRSCSASPACRSTGGFLGKFYVFSAAYDRGWLWLVIVGVVADRGQPLLLPRASSARCTALRPSAELQFAAGGSAAARMPAATRGVLACVRRDGRLVLRRRAADRPRAGRPVAVRCLSRAAAAELLPAPGRDARA